jgi:hypothetical protein
MVQFREPTDVVVPAHNEGAHESDLRDFYRTVTVDSNTLIRLVVCGDCSTDDGLWAS